MIDGGFTTVCNLTKLTDAKAHIHVIKSPAEILIHTANLIKCHRTYQTTSRSHSLEISIFLGIFIVRTLETGLILMRVPVFGVEAFIGVAVILFVILNEYLNRRSAR